MKKLQDCGIPDYVTVINSMDELVAIIDQMPDEPSEKAIQDETQKIKTLGEEDLRKLFHKIYDHISTINAVLERNKHNLSNEKYTVLVGAAKSVNDITTKIYQMMMGFYGCCQVIQE